VELVADLHLHSKYSRAVSEQMVIPIMAKWAKKKGIDLLATADWTHPLWFRELNAQLKEVNEGIFQLINNSEKVSFVLATEIASIYFQGGKSRRIHTLVLVPSFAAVDKINQALAHQGVKLLADGRPITGLSAHDLAERVLTLEPRALIVPAHIWTPWFSLYGSASGFDSLAECFGDLAKEIRAVETGLSSDPLMNWAINDLADKSIISFSDAHSPAKMGREATVFEIENPQELTYEAIRQAFIKQKIAYTIEFYPEEGKYHYTGHRSCRVSYSPDQTQKLGAICPVCGRGLTVGVLDRVQSLAPKKIQPVVKKDTVGVNWLTLPGRPAFVRLVPLLEILAEVQETTPSSQKVLQNYHFLTDDLGSELAILLKLPLEKIAAVAGTRVAEGIKKVRAGEIFISPGYDGQYGIVKVWGETETAPKNDQMSLF
jgi:uncharacterized protein (TIGR00375 family)